MTRTGTLTALAWPSCTLGGWAAAWLTGRCAPDDVLAAVTEDSTRHEIVDNTGELDATAPAVLTLLTALRDARTLAVRLPGPGDPGGLPPGPPTEMAIAAGEVLLVDHATESERGALAVVPMTEVGDVPGDTVCRWHVHRYPPSLDVAALVSGDPSAGELEYELRQGVLRATAIFSELGQEVSRAVLAGLRNQLSAWVSRHQLVLPAFGRDDRPTRLLATAAQVEGIAELAVAQRVSAGPSAAQLDASDTELRRLITVSRGARAAAVNLAITEMLGRSH